MHSPLEQYLTELSTRLAPLPVKHRNEELKEMRQHLLNAVIVNRETGQNDEEAAMSAVEQLGVPEDVAQGLISAWQREKKLRRRDFWGATATTLALLLFLPNLILPLMAAEFSDAFPQILKFEFYGGNCLLQAEFYSIIASVHLTAGAISGLTFKRMPAKGATLAAFIWTISIFLWAAFTPYFHVEDFVVHPICYALLTVFGAFLASRWRETQHWQGSRRHGVQ